MQFRAPLYSKYEKVLIKAKNINKIFNMGIKNRRILRWFWIRWKGFLKFHKKVISKYVRQTCFAYNFFVCIFL